MLAGVDGAREGQEIRSEGVMFLLFFCFVFIAIELGRLLTLVDFFLPRLWATTACAAILRACRWGP